MSGTVGAPPSALREDVVTGVILAGGRAERLGGRPKGLEVVGGERMLDHVARALGAVSDSLLLVANHPDASGWLPGVPLVSDRWPGAAGPLAGLHAGLAHARSDVLVVAWDMPFVTAGLLELLRRRGQGADAAVPEGTGASGLEPLCAWYAARCLPAVEAALGRGERRADAALPTLRVARVPRAELALVAPGGDVDHLLQSVNTPADLARARAFGETLAASDPRARDPRPSDP